MAGGSGDDASPRMSSSGSGEAVDDARAEAASTAGDDPVTGAPDGAAAHAPSKATTRIAAVERRSSEVQRKVVAG